jgi:hypothetical protein
METADRLLHEITFVGFEWVELMIVGELKIQNFGQFKNQPLLFLKLQIYQHLLLYVN